MSCCLVSLSNYCTRVKVYIYVITLALQNELPSRVLRALVPRYDLVNGLHLYSAFIQSAAQFIPLIHPFTLTFTHQRRLAAMQGTNQLVRSNRGLGVSLRDTSTRPGWDRTGNPPTARRPPYLLSHIAPFALYCTSLWIRAEYNLI